MGLEFESYQLDKVLLLGSLLLIASVLAIKISSSFGLPSLLLFLIVGMLAGSEGPGGIEFDNYALTFAIGSVGLSIIIFDGGLRTSWKKIKPILPLGISLSVIGTVVTAASTGIFARYVFDLTWSEGLLLGAIVSSTDAAAVFSILRSKNLGLRKTLKQLLEFEAGSNDPVGVFLTAGLLSVTMSLVDGPLALAGMLFWQGLLGLIWGWLGGRAICWLLNTIGIEYEGLYGVLLLGLVIFLFAGTSALNGSGFLAVYVAGIVIGNSEFIHKGSVVRFHDGIAWIAQILVFLTLGLLVFPSHLLDNWRQGLLLSLFLIFIGRPLSVLIAASLSTFGPKERMFVSWVGLRGAAPIILATLPWSVGFPKSEYFFNLVFFVVLTSVISQGISIPWLAKKLGITVEIRFGVSPHE